MRQIEFVSYTGKYPNLCGGELRVRVEGKERLVDSSLISGGTCYWDSRNLQEILTAGAWSVYFRDESFTPEEQARIVELVNANVPHGCCGGCM